jgi:hypothetical protein
MALPLKTAGMAELTAFRKRVKRQLALERIDPQPAGEILERLNQIEAIIQTMREEGADGDD